MFITSPFSALEDLAPSYGNVYVGFLLNFVPVFIMLAVASYIYPKNVRLKSLLRVSDIFVIGVASSYLLSAVYWFYFKIPSRGTSIIAITLLIYFLIYTLTFDFRRLFIKKAKANHSKRTKEISAYITLVLLLIIIFLILGSNYGPSLVHVIGGLISFSLIEFTILWREHYRIILSNFKI